MRAISKEELEAAVAHRSPGERISFREVEIWNMDLTGMDLSNMEFESSYEPCRRWSSRLRYQVMYSTDLFARSFRMASPFSFSPNAR